MLRSTTRKVRILPLLRIGAASRNFSVASRSLMSDTSYCTEFSSPSIDRDQPPSQQAAAVYQHDKINVSVTSSILDCIHNTAWSSLFEDTQEDVKKSPSHNDSWLSDDEDYKYIDKLATPEKVHKEILLRSPSPDLKSVSLVSSAEAQVGIQLLEASGAPATPKQQISKEFSSDRASLDEESLSSPIRKRAKSVPVSLSSMKNTASGSSSPRPVKVLTPKEAITASTPPPPPPTPPSQIVSVKVDASVGTPPKILVSRSTQNPERSHQVSPFIIPNNNTISTTLSGVRLFSSSTTATRSSMRPLASSSKVPENNHTILLSTQKPSEVDSSGEVKSVKPIILSREQEHILQLANYGTSLFYTGSAGTGKSVLLKSIIKSLKQRHEIGSVAVTASTGLAACNIGGTTLHSFAGVGLGDMEVQKCLVKVKRNKLAYKRWLKVKVLIIDEISMIDGVFLDKLNAIAKKIRKNNLPFGGIQLIVSGDFYQLPPVLKKTVQEELHGYNKDSATDSVFAFECEAWQETIQCTLILKEVFRQKGDQEFVDMLNEMRTGKVSKANEKKFRYLERKLADNDGIEAAELFPTRVEVDQANNQRLYALPGSAQVYQSIDSGELPAQQRFTILNNSLATSRLFLKKNAQVMCIKNFDETLVNGSLGQVVDFMDRNTYMAYLTLKENGGGELAAQDAELIVEKVIREEEKLRKTKTDLPVDTNMSHSQNIPAGSPLRNSIFDFILEVPIPEDEEIQTQFIQNQRRKIDLLLRLHETASTRKYPVVRFLLPDGHNTREVLVEPEEWTTEDENGVVLARRVQLPLILAWSLSIHKSQGQTLPKVKVDLRKVFERGQAYVALSRAVSRRGLQILNFRTERVMVHEKVNRFYETLLTAEEIQQKGRQGKIDEEGKEPIVSMAIENTKRTKRIDEYMVGF